jgi:hypothetical protein
MDNIPFEFLAPDIPLIVLQGHADNLPVSVVLDTGAVGSFPLFLSEGTAGRLNLPLSEPVFPARSTSVGPARQSYRTTTLSAFRLGPLALQDATVSVTSVVDRLSAATGSRVQGIIGYDLLKDRRVSLDYTAKRVDFTAPVGPAEAALPFSVAPTRPITLVTAGINGAGPFTFEIDTGASASSLSPAAAKRAGVKAFGTGKLVGAGGAVTVRVGAARVTFGGVTRDLPMVNITPEIECIGKHSGIRLDGIIGADFLAGTKLTLDYPARRVWISESALQR